MSSVPPPTPPATTPPPLLGPSPELPNEITIVSHSNLFYWWPVWAVGFIMGILTYFGGYVASIVPGENARAIPAAKSDWEVKEGDGFTKHEGILIIPKPGQKLTEKADQLPRKLDNPDVPEQPHLRIADHKMYGIIFAFVLLLVIVITNVPLRGMWSLLVILLVVLMVMIFYIAGLWKPILELVSRLDIRITMGGYFLISTILFIVWVVTFVFFDRQVYMTFTPGQLKVCTEIGGGEKVYDAVGMTMEKQRSDLFRHWILGLGSGDLIVRTSGAQAHQFDLPNVLFIGRKVARIEQMMKKKSVVGIAFDAEVSSECEVRGVKKYVIVFVFPLRPPHAAGTSEKGS